VSQQDEGKLMAGGPFTDPTDGAVFIWKDVPVEEVEEFVKTDPYVINGLVPSWKIRQYLAVVR